MLILVTYLVNMLMSIRSHKRQVLRMTLIIIECLKERNFYKSVCAGIAIEKRGQRQGFCIPTRSISILNLTL